MGQRSALIMSVVVALVFGFVMAQHFEDEAARQRTLAVANGMLDELENRAARPQPMPVQEAAAMKHDDEKEMVAPVEGDADGVVCNKHGICHIAGKGEAVDPEGAARAQAAGEIAQEKAKATQDRKEAESNTVCDLALSDDVEKGVVFVTDDKAESLFVSEAAWNKAKTIRTVMPSVPGAGNTWMRLLVEKGAGLRTGAVFGDGFLKADLGMAGEGRKDTTVM